MFQNFGQRYATEVTTHEELVQINKLNQQNLLAALSESEQEDQGFVTWLYQLSLLEAMHSIAPSIIVKESDEVVGYALVTPREAGEFHADLKTMIDNVDMISYKGSSLSTHNYYIMGQVCIHKEHRGQGIFSLLFQKHKEIYSEKYDMLITEISTRNHRSQKAHEKVGFKTIHTYRDELDEWNVVVWDWGIKK